MKRKFITISWLLTACIIGAGLLTSCGVDDNEWAAEREEQAKEEVADARPLVAHEVSVTLEGAGTRVGYTSADDGLQLAWEANETLGVYIQKANNTYVYAGTVSSTGTACDRGIRNFSGEVSSKLAEGEQYVYIHPALPEGEKGSAAAGKIDFFSQSGALGSTAHLKHYIPLVWHEGDSRVSNQGYAVHLQLTFNEDPGTITKVTLQTMPTVGVTKIFPASFDASAMAASTTKNEAVTLTVTAPATATQSGEKWTADAYLVCSHCIADVFRTKYNVKVEAQNGTFYNEFLSFPGQESATSETRLEMLANGKCYNLAASMSKGVATTVINSQYKVNSLMGMWNKYGKTTDPFQLTRTSDLPGQLQTNILAQQETFTTRTQLGASTQGTPTFTWTMVTKQCAGAYRQENVTYNNIEIIDQPTEVYVTFVSEYAWSQNLLGYYHYPTGSVPSHPSEVLKTIIFPNVSKPAHVPYNRGGSVNTPNVNPNTSQANVGAAADAPLAEYTTVQLLYNAPDGTVSTQFPEGTTIGFFMMRDPKASSSGHDEDTEHEGADETIDHSSYQPREDNTLIDWTAWRLFTNTSWNGAINPYTSAYNNVGWWNMNCWNFFCSADVGDRDNGGVISGLALYGAKDDASHNYNYSFSAMLYLVSTSNPSSMKTSNKAYFNIGTGDLIVDR